MGTDLDNKDGIPFEASSEYLYQKKIIELHAQLSEAQRVITDFREALCFVFITARPAASFNEWSCFKAADKALAKHPAPSEKKAE